LKFSEIMVRVQNEISSAKAKFPSNKQLLHAFVEEAGEVTKAFLDMDQKDAPPEDITKELIQTIAMAVRLLQEGDPEFPQYKGK